MVDAASELRIYIDYEYLAVQQLGELLVELNELFDKILYAEAPYLRDLSSAPAARLRIASVVTGESITVCVTQGVMQVIGSSDPALVRVVGGAGALVVLGRLVIRLLSRVVDLRAKWRHDNRADESQQLELAEKRLDLIGKGLELRSLIEAEQSRQLMIQDTMEILTEQLPDRSPAQLEALAEQLKPHVSAFMRTVSDPNIRRVDVTLAPQDE
jgi:hypothetical protein